MKRRLILIYIMIIFACLNVFAEGEATLKNLKVSNVPCVCSGYECNVEVDATMAKITYDLVDPKATVDRLSGFTIELLSQVTVVKITVSNTVNDQKIENVYNISITKHEKSNDFSLKSLKINGSDIKLVEEVIVYSYECDYNVEKLTIDAVPNDPKARVIKEDSYVFDKENSSIAVDFAIEAENKERKNYRIVVTRGVKPDTTLKSLIIEHGNINFDKDTLQYEFNVEYSINKLKIDAIPNVKTAKVEIVNNDLVVGENEVKIIVTNGKSKSEYILLVTREENLDKSVANLKELKVDEYPKLDFEENVLDYNLKFSTVPAKLTIHAKAKAEDSKITILNNENLKVGSKVIVRVSLNNSSITREYAFLIQEKNGISDNKTFILISIIVLLIVIIVLFIIEIKERKIAKKKYLNKIFELRRKKEKKKKEEKKHSKKEEEEIEII